MSGDLFKHIITCSIENKTTGDIDFNKAQGLLDKIHPAWNKEELRIDNRLVYYKTYDYFDKVLDKYKFYASFDGPYEEDVEWFVGFLTEYVKKISAEIVISHR
jgi:hypothetical protein